MPSIGFHEVTMSRLQVFIESFQRAIGKEAEEVAELSWIGIAYVRLTSYKKIFSLVRLFCRTMVSTIVIKGVVWVWCSRIPTTAVKALAQDAENDG